jgi:hypothetical protein
MLSTTDSKIFALTALSAVDECEPEFCACGGGLVTYNKLINTPTNILKKYQHTLFSRPFNE